MKIKIAALALALCLCLTLSGCRFAADERVAEADVLAGVSLRIENFGQPTGVDEDGNAYYAYDGAEETELSKAQMEALLRGEDITTTPRAYGIGERYFYVHTETDERGNVSTGIEQAGWPGSMSTHITATDEGDKYECDAVVYVTGGPFGGEDLAVLQMHNIYVRPDGSVYAARESGGVSGSIDGFSREIRQSSKITDARGETESWEVRFKVEVRYANALTEAAILAFDAEGALISRQRLSWVGLEDAITYALPDGAAYLILEERGLNAEGGEEIKRTLLDKPAEAEADLFTLYIADGTGFAVPLTVRAE